MFENKYPYTDFSQLNLDWFLLKFKELLEEQERVSGKVKDLDDTVKEFTDFVTNYFDDLDVQQEINNKLDEMAADGTLTALIAPLVGDDIQTSVTEWLNENVDPVGSAVVVDSSLSVSGAAADAKTVGDNIIIKANKINLEMICFFDDASSFETDGTYVYLYWLSQFHTRGVSGRNLDISLTQAKTQVGSSHVATSPSGKECVVISGTEWFVYDTTISQCAVIDRSNFDFNRYILLLGQSNNYVDGGIMYNNYLSYIIENDLTTAFDLKLILKANKNNLSFTSAFDDVSSFETDGTYVYLYWTSQFHTRGVSGRNLDISLTQAKTQVGSSHVATSPSGKECVVISGTEWFVYDTTISQCAVIDRSNFDFNRYILLASNTFGRMTNGEMYNQYIENMISEINSKELSKSVNKLFNARHIIAENGTPLTLLHFSDLHADDAALKRIMKDAEKYTSKINGYICTGDMVANEAGQISSWWDNRIMTCIGNHDSASYNQETGYDWTALSMADRDNYYITPFKSNWGITHTAGTSYYYKDYSTQKIRLIVMDVMLYNTPESTEAADQTTWLENLLSDAVTNSLHVLIAIHAPHGGASAKDCSFSKYGQGVMPTMIDCNTPQTVIDIVNNAITSGLHFIGYIVGHTHQDNMWDAENDGKQLMYNITCAAVSAKTQWINSDQYRSETADAYNLITIDTANTLVKIIRCGGANIDNLMRTRKAISFNYSTGQILGEIL